MKTIRNPFVIGLLVVLTLGLVGTAFAATPVFAQSTTPPATPAPKAPASPDTAARAILRLERLFQNEQKMLERQAAVLDRGARLVDRAETIITSFQEKGIDTSKLEAALKTFEGQLAGATASHAKAADILKTHAGFDAQGKVTDRVTAAQTVKDAGQALKGTHQTIAQGRKEILDFIRQWRKDHKPTQP